MTIVVTPIQSLDATLGDLLTDIVLYCDPLGHILYANSTAQQWSSGHLYEETFVSLLHPDVHQKGNIFFDAAKKASPQHPTPHWELAVGHTHYTVATFRGYQHNGHVVLVGQTESSEVSEIQQEMGALTSELSQAQRDLRRQNRSLQQLLDEQRQFVQTIQELTAPAILIWNHVLLLPLVGHIDTQRAKKITENVLQRVSETQAVYVLLDMSGIAFVDTDVAKHLVHMAQALQLLGAVPVLVGINPDIAETVVQLGIGLDGFIVHNDVYRALAYVLYRLKSRI
jgi:anti-anti-sigma regulatory factor